MTSPAFPTTAAHHIDEIVSKCATVTDQRQIVQIPVRNGTDPHSVIDGAFHIPIYVQLIIFFPEVIIIA